jgi:hypothetical protein
VLMVRLVFGGCFVSLRGWMGVLFKVSCWKDCENTWFDIKDRKD